MYTFDDGGGRSVTLRPEGTAPICRAYVEHGMHKLPQPVKLWYLSSFFRQEKPQAGRFRQFWQIGAEAIGSDDPAVDAEIDPAARDAARRARGRRPAPADRQPRHARGARTPTASELQAYLRAHADELSRGRARAHRPQPAARLRLRPPGHARGHADAPLLLDRLDADDAEHFATVRELLDRAQVDYEVDPTLVRGLDYYTRTVFEFTSDALGAQSGVAGGGRYDGLVEQLGGPPTPGCGWAAGIERILLAAGRPAGRAAAGRSLRRVRRPPAQRAAAFAVAAEARRARLNAQLELAGRSRKGQLKQADRLGARYVAIVGDDGDGAEGHADGRAAGRCRGRGRDARSCASGACGEARAARQPLPRRLGGDLDAPSARARRRASPAGCTAAATTAG